MACCFGSKGLRNRAFIAFGLHAGMRVGTIAGLTVADVVGSHGRCLGEVCISASREKSNRSHRYFISKQGQAIINDYISSISVEDGSMPLFPGRNGKFMSQPSASRIVANLLVKAGIHNNSSHALRKTFARSLLDAGVSVPAISKALNHASIQTTVRYLGEHQEQIQNAVALLKY